jgi:hypothetical protein
MVRVLRPETGEERSSSTDPEGFFDLSNVMRNETGVENEVELHVTSRSKNADEFFSSFRSDKPLGFPRTLRSTPPSGLMTSRTSKIYFVNLLIFAV